MFLVFKSSSSVCRPIFERTTTKSSLKSNSLRILWSSHSTARLSFHITRQVIFPLLSHLCPLLREYTFSMQPFLQVNPFVINAYPSLIILIEIFTRHRGIFYYSTTRLVIPGSSGVRISVRSLRTLFDRKLSNPIWHKLLN